MISLVSFQKMSDNESKVFQDVPKRIEGESNEQTKCSSKVRDQRDKSVTVNLMWETIVTFFGQTPQSK